VLACLFAIIEVEYDMLERLYKVVTRNIAYAKLVKLVREGKIVVLAGKLFVLY